MKKLRKILLLLGVTLILVLGCTVQAAEVKTTTTSTAVKKGLKKRSNGKYYYYVNGKRLRNSWKVIKGKRYYFTKGGSAATGSWKIKGVRYIFNAKGQLAKTGKTTLVKVGEKSYLANAKGRPLTGWQIYKNKLYYANSKGMVLKNVTKDGIKLTKTGAAKSGVNTNLKMKVMAVIKSITNDSMSQSQKLRACWEYVVDGNFYYASVYPNLEKRGWQKRLALTMLNTKGGNCYGFACAFAALAEEIGYEPYVICGKVLGTRDGSADGYTRHSWVMINDLHYDPEAQYAGWAKGIYGSEYGPGIIQQTVKFN